MTKKSVKLESMWSLVHGRPMHARTYVHPAAAGVPDVVLVHGLGVSSHYMVPTALKLAPSCSVYAPDLPGFGKSADPPQVLDVPGMADALDAWMTSIGLADACFIGNSMGCQAIIDLAVRYPHRVRSAVLTGPTFDRASRAFFPGLLLRVVRDGRWEPRALSPIIVYDYLSAGLLRIARTLRLGLLDPVERKLSLMQAPALVVRGEHDSVAPLPWAKYVAFLLPMGRVVVIKGVSHAVNFSAPEKLARISLRFFSSSSAPPVPADATVPPVVPPES